jgi:hypothetical protein
MHLDIDRFIYTSALGFNRCIQARAILLFGGDLQRRRWRLCLGNMRDVMDVAGVSQAVRKLQ